VNRVDAIPRSSERQLPNKLEKAQFMGSLEVKRCQWDSREMPPPLRPKPKWDSQV
jgi:hypothetical protein